MNDQKTNDALTESRLNVGLGTNSAQEDCARFGDALTEVFECDPELKAQMIDRGLIIPTQN